MKRKFIQLIFFIFQNPFIHNFIAGRPYAGPLKTVCVPGLHCYSCPAMAFSCPLGTIQYVIKYASAIPYLAIGTLMSVAAIFGSASCAYFCPFGLIQELFYGISPWKKKIRIRKGVRHLKWGFLLIFVLLMPLLDLAQGFCAYICPSGMLTAGIPILSANSEYFSSMDITFYWKLFFLIAVILYAMYERRAFCRYICPLGLMLGLANRFSFYKIKIEKNRCKECDLCVPFCPMGLEPRKEINTLDCIKCGDCVDACPAKFNALSRGFNAKRN